MEFYSLSASALADQIDFNRSTISHLISGRNKPSLEFVMKLLQKFPEVDLDWLVLGKGVFPSDSSPKQEKPKSPTAEGPDLFTEVGHPERTSPSLSDRSIIDRIVIFYKDGTFQSYEK